MASRLHIVIETSVADQEAMVARLRGLGFSATAEERVSLSDGSLAMDQSDEALLAILDALDPQRILPIRVIAAEGNALHTGDALTTPGNGSETQLRAIINAMTEGVVVIDTSGHIVLVNPAIMRILGYTREELLGRNVSMLAPEPFRSEHDGYIADFLNIGVGKILGAGLRQIEALHKNGSLIPVEVALSEAPDHGTPTFIAVLRDVTERRRTDDALRHSEANMIKAQRLASLGNWDWRVAEDRLEWSAETYRILGVLPENHDGTAEAFFSRVHPEDQRMARDHIEAVVDGKVDCNIEHRIVRDDGEIRILHVLGEAERAPSGKAVRLFGTAQDVTEDRRKDELLRESEQRLAEAASMAQVGYMEWDVASDSCHFCSDIYAAIHGVTQEDYVANAAEIDAPHRFTHPDDIERFRRANRALRTTGEPQELEYRLITPDGETRHVRESLKAKRNAAGTVTHEMCTMQDITELRAAEQRLIQAQKREAIGNLTGGVAHDFNNILAVILGNLEMLELRLGDDPELLRLLNTAIGATERGGGLTRQLLAFSRQQELDPKIVEIDSFVTRMGQMLERTFSAAITLEISPGAPDGRIRVDPGQLEAALLNLAINASDAMPDGGKLVIDTSIVVFDEASLITHSDASIGHHVCISVRDTGQGIPNDVIDKVFEPFFTTKEVGAGTGLGLSMVSGFVQQSGGHINIYSEEDHGTRVRLYLPLSEQIAAEAVILPDTVFRAATILLVEDDEGVRQTANTLLEARGYHVICEADGPSAIRRLAEREDIELLFTDMIMPGGINGNELAKRALEMRPDLRILLTSGYPGDAFLDGRQFAFLPKPYNERDMSRAVQNALDGPLYTAQT